MLFLIEGIVLLLLGIAAILLPVVATITFTLLIGWLFLISGVLGLITTLWMRTAPGFWWSLVSASSLSSPVFCCCSGRSPARCP